MIREWENPPADKPGPLLKMITLGIALLLVIVVEQCGSRVRPEVAVKALETQGYTQVVIKDHEWFAVGLKGCDGGDAAKFTAEATNPAGKRVEVYVCTGWLSKGATIRTKLY